MVGLLRRFLKDESGATAIEYGLMAGACMVAIVSIVQGLGPKVATMFAKVVPGLQ